VAPVDDGDSQQEPAPGAGRDLRADPGRFHGGARRERGAASVVLTLGASGALAASDRCVQVPPVGAERVDATGAGDALIAGVLYATLRGDPLEAAARLGTLAAALTIGSVSSVRPDISAAVLEAARAT
ncbi:MAG: carbohydrate kinase family protein, partial [Firmicutes bacterium]|nr:carbohydrate kinase family protein [Bacillota bacterium]